LYAMGAFLYTILMLPGGMYCWQSDDYGVVRHARPVATMCTLYDI